MGVPLVNLHATLQNCPIILESILKIHVIVCRIWISSYVQTSLILHYASTMKFNSHKNRHNYYNERNWSTNKNSRTKGRPHLYTNSVFTILVMPELTLMHVWVYYSSTATCYCIFYVFDRILFVLAWTPPPGLTISHVCLQSLLVHWLSHLAVGSGSVWTHMRTAPGTPGSETPSLPHRSAMNTFQWWGCLAHLLLGTWCWRLHTTASWCDTWSGRHQPDDPEGIQSTYLCQYM